MESSKQIEVIESPQAYPLDAIVILGAKAEKVDGVWRLPEVIESENGKVVAGESRARAAVQAFREHQTHLFLVTGGYETEANGEKISRAKIMENWMNIYGLAGEDVDVELIGNGGDTKGNNEDLISYLKKYPEILQTKRIGILTNRYHMERALLSFDDPFFQEQGIELIPVIVEDYQARYNPDAYEDWEWEMNQTPAMEERIALEKAGVGALKSGTYKRKS